MKTLQRLNEVTVKPFFLEMPVISRINKAATVLNIEIYVRNINSCRVTRKTVMTDVIKQMHSIFCVEIQNTENIGQHILNKERHGSRWLSKMYSLEQKF